MTSAPREADGSSPSTEKTARTPLLMGMSGGLSIFGEIFVEWRVPAGCRMGPQPPSTSPRAALTRMVFGTFHLNFSSSTRATMPMRMACQDTPKSSVPA